MKIGNKEIGTGRTYIIAEFGVNHNGSLERAKEGIIAAAEAGADAIKFQTYTADELVVKGTPKFWSWEGDKDKETQHDAYKALEGFKDEWYPELIKCCEENNIEFLSTPFSIEGADFLNSLGVKAFKIASSDMSSLQFVKHVASFGKPILLSTGASTGYELNETYQAIRSTGNSEVVILHCMLKYPTPEEDANVSNISYLREQYRYVGVSDHTLGVLPALVSIAKGACVVEKHFTVDKNLGVSADHWLSLDPTELEELVVGARLVESMEGEPRIGWYPIENETRLYDKRSLVAKVDIPANTKITEDMLTAKRPGTGIWPNKIDKVIGLTSAHDIKADDIITWTLFE